MNKITLFLIVFISFFTNAQQKAWTLNQCLEIGLQNSLEIKIKQIEIKRTQKVQNSVWNQLLPTISFSGNQSYNFGSTIDQSTNGRVSSNIQNDNFYLNASMELINLASLANAQKSKIDVEKANAEKEIIENEYQLQLAESYFQALFSQELLKIQKEQLKNAQFNLIRIEKEVTTGSKPQSDLYDIQLQFSQEEKRILETQQLLEIQKTQLFQLMNVLNIAIDTIVLEPYITKKEKEEITTINNPKIKFAELSYKKSLKQISSQKGNNLPTLSAFYNFSTFYTKPINNSTIIIDNFSLSIQPTLSQ